MMHISSLRLACSCPVHSWFLGFSNLPALCMLDGKHTLQHHHQCQLQHPYLICTCYSNAYQFSFQIHFLSVSSMPSVQDVEQPACVSAAPVPEVVTPANIKRRQATQTKATAPEPAAWLLRTEWPAQLAADACQDPTLQLPGADSSLPPCFVNPLKASVMSQEECQKQNPHMRMVSFVFVMGHDACCIWDLSWQN